MEKRGFSIAEAMITLLIVSVALAAMAPMMTKKAKPVDSEGNSKWEFMSNLIDITRATGSVFIGHEVSNSLTNAKLYVKPADTNIGVFIKSAKNNIGDLRIMDMNNNQVFNYAYDGAYVRVAPVGTISSKMKVGTGNNGDPKARRSFSINYGEAVTALVGGVSPIDRWPTTSGLTRPTATGVDNGTETFITVLFHHFGNFFGALPKSHRKPCKASGTKSRGFSYRGTPNLNAQ